MNETFTYEYLQKQYKEYKELEEKIVKTKILVNELVKYYKICEGKKDVDQYKI